MGIQIEWSWSSLFLYVILSLASMWMIYYTKHDERCMGKPIRWNNKYLIIVCILWTFFATFRLVTYNGIGGMDAYDYIEFFNKCNNQTYTTWMLHVGDDVIFKWINKIIRYLTSDYHVYFAIVYGFIAWAYLWFISRFTPIKSSIIPYVLSFFLFWRSMNTLRSNLAIAFIMVACVFLLNKKYYLAYLFAFMAALTHKAAILFALAIPFIHIFKYYKLKTWHIISFIIISFMFGKVFQGLFIQYSQEIDLQGAYGSYASRSIEGEGFMGNAWKIAFEQIVLGIFIVLSSAKIERLKMVSSPLDSDRINIIKLICIFDLILIPINYLLNIWRGYEFFYLPRIVMWGIILYIILYQYKMQKEFAKIFSMVLFLIFLLWYIFRINRMFEPSGLMPYIFEPLQYI